MANPPKLLDRVRMAIRTRHYSIRTEVAYVDWIRRYIVFHNKTHPSAMGAEQINQFLTHLAVEKNVAASTQNQALSALLFLYREVLGEDIPWIADLTRAKKPKRLPVVLTRREVSAVLGRMARTERLLAELLYGTGMRLIEAVRLRVKDVDFEKNEVTVRDGKGQKDRVTMLPIARGKGSGPRSSVAARRGLRPAAWALHNASMPELPDITIYVDALTSRVAGKMLDAIRLGSPFVLRTVDPSPSDLAGHRVERVGRMGKRIILELEADLFVVIHLMIAGRLKWSARGAKLPGKAGLAAIDFENGTLILTEAGSKRRAAIHLLHGRDALERLDPGGAEIFEIDLAAFSALLRSGNHTLKRTLTDPHLFSGIGNAYSDEILHAALLSPVKLTSKLSDEEIARLFEATRGTLTTWIERLRAETGDGFPEKVTAFRDDMAVHGKFGRPCPVCGTTVQRIVYAENETNYCARCQTGGKLLADRALSRLLHSDWPKSIDDVE